MCLPSWSLGGSGGGTLPGELSQVRRLRQTVARVGAYLWSRSMPSGRDRGRWSRLDLARGGQVLSASGAGPGLLSCLPAPVGSGPPAFRGRDAYGKGVDAASAGAI